MHISIVGTRTESTEHLPWEGGGGEKSEVCFANSHEHKEETEIEQATPFLQGMSHP